MSRDISAILTSNSDEWATPWDIFADLDEEFHLIFDPACTTENVKCPHRCGHDEGVDGLGCDWRAAVVDDEEDRFKYAVFLNPPHSNIEAWLAKTLAEARRGCRIVGLIPANTDTVWWHKYVMEAREIRFVERRICFIGIIKKPGQPKDLPKDKIEYVMGTAPATFPSAIVVWDDIRWDARGRPKISSYIQPKNRGKQSAEDNTTPATEPAKKPRKPRKKPEPAPSTSACHDVQNICCGQDGGGEMADMSLASQDEYEIFLDGM